VLLIESIDRLFRDQIRNARDRMEEILMAGVQIHTLSPERVYTKESLSDPFALVMMVLEFSRAYDYSRQLSARLSAAWEGKRDKAKTKGTPLSRTTPAWLKNVDGTFVVIPERAAVVQQIFEMSADQSMGIELITKTLIQKQIPPFGKKPWCTATVAKILSSEAAGHHHPCQRDPETRKKLPPQRIDNLFPPVVDEALYARARVAMRERRASGGPVSTEPGLTSLFTGLLRSHDDSPIFVKWRKTGRKNPVMMPMIRDEGTQRTYPLENFAALVLSWLAQDGIDLTGTEQPVNQEIRELNERNDKLAYKIQVLKDKITSADDFEALLEPLREISEQHKEAVRKREQLQARIPGNRALDEYRTTLNTVYPDLATPKGITIIHTADYHFGSVTTADPDSIIKLRAALRRLLIKIEVQVGAEHRFWSKKSLRVTVTFRSGSTAEFTHTP
jgi:hypothetical protein